MYILSHSLNHTHSQIQMYTVVCIHVCIHTHTHTHTHIHTDRKGINQSNSVRLRPLNEMEIQRMMNLALLTLLRGLTFHLSPLGFPSTIQTTQSYTTTSSATHTHTHTHSSFQCLL